MPKQTLARLIFITLATMHLAALSACSKAPSSEKEFGENTGSTAIASKDAQSQYATLAADLARVEAGKNAFSACTICHSMETGAEDMPGPNLTGLLGRKIGSVKDFSYSTALKNADGIWTPEKVDAFIQNPQAIHPGTTMAFGGIANAEERQSIIAYLASNSVN